MQTQKRGRFWWQSWSMKEQKGNSTFINVCRMLEGSAGNDYLEISANDKEQKGQRWMRRTNTSIHPLCKCPGISSLTEARSGEHLKLFSMSKNVSPGAAFSCDLIRSSSAGCASINSRTSTETGARNESGPRDCKHVREHWTALHTIRKNLQRQQAYKSAKRRGAELWWRFAFEVWSVSWWAVGRRSWSGRDVYLQL